MRVEGQYSSIWAGVYFSNSTIWQLSLGIFASLITTLSNYKVALAGVDEGARVDKTPTSSPSSTLAPSNPVDRPYRNQDTQVDDTPTLAPSSSTPAPSSTSVVEGRGCRSRQG